MDTQRLASQVRIIVLVCGLCFSAQVARAQNSTSTERQAVLKTAAAKTTTTTPAVADADSEMLRRASGMYYSTQKEGLTGFDCAVYPDWHQLLVSANNSPVEPNSRREAALKPVKITLHARMNGGSSLEWEAPNVQYEKDLSDMLSSVHAGTEQTLMGFLQFWTPFVDGSIVPSSPGGLNISHTANGTRIHSSDKDTDVTEDLDENLVLVRYDVKMSGSSVEFAPSYKYTERGLLVNNFLSHIVQDGAAGRQSQELHVSVEYQTVDGFPIPGKLWMTVVGTGDLNFEFDSCKVSHK